MTVRSHLPVLDHLRGFAAVAVCIFHFTNGNDQLLSEADPVRFVGSYGWLGVQIFFVISGFVIPYSLHQRSYVLKDSGEFLLRRLKRIEPPYFASILLVVTLNFLVSRVPGFRGEPFRAAPIQLAAHIAYLNAILDYGWLNPVYWTLAIEFQYYLFVALVFPLVNGPSLTTGMVSVLGISMLSILFPIDNDTLSRALLPHWLPLFAMGMLTFQQIAGHFRPHVFTALLGILAGICWRLLGHEQTIAGVLTAVAILGFRFKEVPSLFRPFALAGRISYSIYLVHIPFGMRVVNLAVRLPADTVAYRYMAVVVALLISVVFATLFWKYVEQPAQRWAKISR